MTARLQAVDEPPPGFRRNVGIMLLNAQGLAFVGERIDSPGAWQMPQGGIDEGETPRQAALRELEEEVGTAKAEILWEEDGWLVYEFPADLAGSYWRGKWRGQAQKWFVLRFTGADSDIAIETAHPEFSRWRWAPRSELSSVIVPFKRPVYEAITASAEPRLAALGF